MFLLLLVISLSSRVLYIIKYPVPVRDSFFYARVIREWNENGVIPIETGTPPLSLYLLGIPNRFLNYDIIKGGICVNLIFGIVFVLLVWHMAYIITCSSIKSFLVGLLVCIHPELIQFSCNPIRENSYLLFLIGSLYFLTRYIKNDKSIEMVFGSLLAAAAFMCRLEGLEIALVYSVIILLVGIKKRCMIKAARDIISFSFLFVVSLVLISYSINVPLDYYMYYSRDLSPNRLNISVQPFDPIK